MAPKDMVVAFEKKRYGSSGDSRLDLLLLIQVSSCHKTVNSIRKPSQINLSTDYFSESKFVIFRHENRQKKRGLLIRGNGIIATTSASLIQSHCKRNVFAVKENSSRN